MKLPIYIEAAMGVSGSDSGNGRKKRNDSSEPEK